MLKKHKLYQANFAKIFDTKAIQILQESEAKFLGKMKQNNNARRPAYFPGKFGGS
jgi:hypothetical protein